MARALTKKQIAEVLDALEETFPEAKAELNFTNPFELLIATILSAQTTDKQVNRVTADLFPKYPTPEALANANPAELEMDLKRIGLYRNKAKNIRAAAQMLCDTFDGEVPREVEDLTKLPGVGQKTANVVRSNAFDIPAIAVDTHVFRVSNRIGMSQSDTVEECEKQLCRRIDPSRWSKSHHLLIFQGRYVCNARSPKCEQCSITSWCQYYQRLLKEAKKKTGDR